MTPTFDDPKVQELHEITFHELKIHELFHEIHERFGS